MIRYFTNTDTLAAWVRVYNSTDGTTMTIKSFAWNDVNGGTITPGLGDPNPPTNVSNVASKTTFDYYVGKDNIIVSNLDANEDVTMVVYGISGRQLFTEKINNGTYPISLAQGMYLVKIMDKTNQTITTNKVMVQ